MTNAEKFKEVFGFDVNTNMCACDIMPVNDAYKVCNEYQQIISPDEANCDNCPFTSDFWNMEYRRERIDLNQRKFDKYVKKLKTEYETALKSSYVNKPMSWALYRTWRDCDSVEKWRNEENEQATKEKGI